MNPLASRKKLLIAESELNRAQLGQDWWKMTDVVHAFATKVRMAGSLASTVAALVAGVASFHHKIPAPVAEKPSWLQTILKGAGLVSTLWAQFGSSHRNEDRD
jgi:hypothetical protein